MKKIFALCFLFVVASAAGVLFIALPLAGALSLPTEVTLTMNEYQNENPLPTSALITQRNNRAAAVSDAEDRYIDLKLFGLFDIKRIKVDIMPYESLAVGGVPIGFVAKTNGLIVLEDAGELKKGDIITSLSGRAVYSIEDFNSVVNAEHISADQHNDEQNFEIEYIRDNKPRKTALVADTNPAQTRRLGLWLKDETSGVGILTYVIPENNNFAALGHRMTDHETGARVDVRGGDVYCCNVIGIEKSNGKHVGEFKSTLQQGTHGCQGNLTSGNSGGVFGCLFSESKLLKQAHTIYPVSSRYGVRPGKAKLRTCLDGDTIEEFDIEIIKTHYQKEKATKSMIIRVTDRDLLSRTGGIIHGMSH